MPQPKIVLLVEDDKLLVSTLLKIFEHEKFKVVVETNGLKALSAVKKNRPNLILLDLLLPGMHGFEIMKKLKADENYKNIPIIIISNLGDEADKDEAMHLGADEYFVKANISYEKLIKEINRYLHLYGKAKK